MIFVGIYNHVVLNVHNYQNSSHLKKKKVRGGFNVYS